jgi:hypothetical protein
MIILIFILNLYVKLHAKEIPHEFKSPRYLGMGNAGVSVPAAGGDGLFYNPAHLMQFNGILDEIVMASPMLSIGGSYKKIFENYKTLRTMDALALAKTLKGDIQHIGFQNFTGIVFRRIALGLLQSTEGSFYLGNNTNGNLEGSMNFSSITGASLGLGQNLYQTENSKLSLGLRFKFQQVFRSSYTITPRDFLNDQNILQNTKIDDLIQQSLGYGADLGILWSLPGRYKPNIGISIHNLISSYPWSLIPNTAKLPSDPTTVDIGFAFLPKNQKTQGALSIEYKDLFNKNKENTYKHIHAGIQLSYLDAIGAMIGLSQGYPTYGGFMNLWLLRLEGGSYSEELGLLPGQRESYRVFARVSLGLWLQ